MRKLLLIAIAFVASYTGIAQQVIPNGNLEAWYNVPVSATLNYDDPGSGPTDNWITILNQLASLPAPIGPGPVTVFKTTDANTGSYAAKLVSANFPLIPNDIFIPGMLGTCQMVMTENRALLGRPCTNCKPSKFIGFYKYFPVNGDSAAAVVLLSKWNTVTKHRDTIGIGYAMMEGEVPVYTKIEIPVYYLNADASDSITVLCVSSGGFSAVNFTGGKGQVGSTLFVDDLSLEYPSGIQQSLMPEVGVTTFPNPASGVPNVEPSKTLKNGSFDIYNASGKLVGSSQCSQLKNTIPVYSLPAGTYYYRLVEGKGVMNTGSFSVIR